MDSKYVDIGRAVRGRRRQTAENEALQMQGKRTDPTLLYTFEAVARHSGIAPAADELALTASAVSHRIRDLEARLGLRLFERTTRRVHITDEGRALLQRVKPALVEFERALAGPGPQQRAIRVSVLPSLARAWLLPALPDFYERHPNVLLEIDPTTRKADLLAGDADIAIRYTAKPGEHHYCQRLMGDELMAVASPRYLQKYAHLSGERLLRRRPMFLHPRQPWGDWLRESGFSEEISEAKAVLADTAMLMDAAAQGEGFALGRRSIATPYLRRGALVAPFAVSLPTDKSYFVLASPALERNAGMQVFLDWVHGLAQDDEPDTRDHAANRERFLLQV
jgi:LysR family transcriptional regulator, glycine cleavage system transcriptional activator